MKSVSFLFPKIFIACLLFLYLSLQLHEYTFIPHYKLNKNSSDSSRFESENSYLRQKQTNHLSVVKDHSTRVLRDKRTTTSWLSDVSRSKGTERPIKVGLVNVDKETKEAYKSQFSGLKIETVPVNFEPVSKNLTWEDFFPDWIDEDKKWRKPKCPDIPMPSRITEDYRDLDVILARVPCVAGKETEGIRDVFRLQINLVVANLAVAAAGGVGDTDRTVFVVFKGSCGAMQEIFRCDDVVSHVGDEWVYKPDLTRLKQKVLMPVGSCQIFGASDFVETGDEAWKTSLDRKRFAYATVLHSSEDYVCGAIALAQSIKQTNSTNDLILLHDSYLSQNSIEGLQAAGWKTRLIHRIRGPFSEKGSYNEWNYSKLRIWQLTDYEKVIFLDADILVLKKLDKFFSYPQLSASRNDQMLFNSGIMVIEPSGCMFTDLIAKSYKLASYNGGDQGFLNEAFTWWHRLPSKLNSQTTFMNDAKNKEHSIRGDSYAVHYFGWKPWMCYRDYDCNWEREGRHKFASDLAHGWWWKVYDSMPERLQNFCAMKKSMDSRIREMRAKAMKTPFFPDNHWKIKLKDPRQYSLI